MEDMKTISNFKKNGQTINLMKKQSEEHKIKEIYISELKNEFKKINEELKLYEKK